MRASFERIRGWLSKKVAPRKSTEREVLELPPRDLREALGLLRHHDDDDLLRALDRQGVIEDPESRTAIYFDPNSRVLYAESFSGNAIEIPIDFLARFFSVYLQVEDQRSLARDFRDGEQKRYPGTEHARE